MIAETANLTSEKYVVKDSGFATPAGRLDIKDVAGETESIYHEWPGTKYC
jgi:hypothetical protein